MTERSIEDWAVSILDQLRRVAERYVAPMEFSRLVNNCMRRDDTVYIVEYETVLVAVGEEHMSTLWVELFRRLTGLGVLIHVITDRTSAQISSAIGQGVFHEVHQCRSQGQKIGCVSQIRAIHRGANLVCFGTEFVHSVTVFNSLDFVYRISSLNLPPWRPQSVRFASHFMESNPIHVHREYVVHVLAVAFLFTSLRANRATHNLQTSVPLLAYNRR